MSKKSGFLGQTLELVLLRMYFFIYTLFATSSWIQAGFICSRIYFLFYFMYLLLLFFTLFKKKREDHLLFKVRTSLNVLYLKQGNKINNYVLLLSKLSLIAVKQRFKSGTHGFLIPDAEVPTSCSRCWGCLPRLAQTTKVKCYWQLLFLLSPFGPFWLLMKNVDKNKFWIKLN